MISRKRFHQIINNGSVIAEIPNVPWPQGDWMRVYPNGTTAAFIPPNPITTTTTYYPMEPLQFGKVKTFSIPEKNGSQRISR